MVILSALYECVKFNKLGVYFLVALGILSLVKYLKFRPPLSKWTFLFFAISLGLILRLAWLNFSSHEPRMDWSKGKHVTEDDYINIQAVDLAKGTGFVHSNGKPSSRRPIGYPLFLGLLYKIFGANPSVAWIFHLLLYVSTVVLLFCLTRSIFSDHEALIAALLFCLYPTSIYSVKMTCDEHLFLPLWYLGLLLLFKEVYQGGSKFLWIAYSLLFGYAAMTRTNVIFMPLVVGLSLFLQKKSWSKILMRVVLVVALMLLVDLPWIIRNYKVWGVPMLYTSNAPSIYASVSSIVEDPEGTGHVPKKGEPAFSEELGQAVSERNEGLANKIATRETIRWIVKHPKEFLKMGTVRVIYFISWSRKGGAWPIWYQYQPGAYDKNHPLDSKVRMILEELAYAFYYAIFFSFFFAIPFITTGWRSLKPESRICLILVAACLAFWLMEQTIIFPLRKHRFPLVPLMMIVASYFLHYVLYEFRWERLWNVHSKRAAVRTIL